MLRLLAYDCRLSVTQGLHAMPKLTQTRAERAPLPDHGQRFLWCSEIKGFGCRLTAGSRSWIVQPPYGKKPRITLGAVNALPLEAPEGKPNARDMARAAITAARAGRDPRQALAPDPTSITLAQVWAQYQAAGFPKANSAVRKRPVTVRADKYRWGAHFAKSIAHETVEAIDAARATRCSTAFHPPACALSASRSLRRSCHSP